MRTPLLFASAALLVSALPAAARNLPAVDVVAKAPAMQASIASSLKSNASSIARPGTQVQMHERFGVPTFMWASKNASSEALSAMRAKSAARAGVAASAAAPLAHEDAARAHLGYHAGLYNLSDADVSNASVQHVHDIGRGPVIVQFKQTVDGIEVFREQARVIMGRNHELIGIAGHIASADSAAVAGFATAATSFKLGAADAVAAAFSDLSGVHVDAGEMQALGSLEGGYDSLDLADGVRPHVAGATTQPARARQVWFHTTFGLEPAYYVEVDSATASGSDSFSYVISANDGSILFRNDLTAYDVGPNPYTYRVWAARPDDGNNPSAPFDGPHGNLSSPHPTGNLDSSASPGPVAQVDVTLTSSVYLDDPWLPVGATVTTGNNVDAYGDLSSPDGFTLNSLDFRADVTGPNAFVRTYDATKPNDVNQMKAAVTQMFYNVNFFHDWYYVSGFTEAAGNAQANNYGRGGLANDSIKAEGQDSSGRNNANMNTPADGGRPRMQMFLFDGIAARHLFATGGITNDFPTGVPSGWGISSHDVTGDLVWVNDGVGDTTYPPATTTTTTVHDGCNYIIPAGGGVDPAWANVTGKIAFIDRGGSPPNPLPPTPNVQDCGFASKAVNAQRAGALGVIIGNTTTHGPVGAITMGGTPIIPVTIPAYHLGTSDADSIRAVLQAGSTVTVRMQRAAAVDRDGTIDNQIMAHEWGHYISNRLIGNSAGLTTNMARGMGEGWADTHAMLLTVKEDDAQVGNETYNGVYSLATWVETGGPNANAPNAGLYFGIRRMPYSTDLTKNNMTFKNIQDNSAIPVGVPFQSWPAPNTTAASGGNSEVHNSGEVWATMLWECYASMLRETVGPAARRTFAQARDQWKDYLVAAYKATPQQPTFLDSRDALLSAAYATDLRDYQNFLAAFAKRGAGLGAISPDRYSANNNGVVESFSAGSAIAFVGASIADDVSFCDRDNVLDSGETGTLSITLRNDSPNRLTHTTATVTAVGPNAANITFPAGNTVTFPAASPYDSVIGTAQIAMVAGLTSVQNIDLQITYGDTDLLPSSANVNWSRRGNLDDVTAQSQTDDVESSTIAWSSIPLGATSAWFKQEITAYDHNYGVKDVSGIADLSLISTSLLVGTSSNFVISFKHRYNFEQSGTTVFFDGGVVEINSDGINWVDIGTLATGNTYLLANPTTFRAISTGGGNPIEGRPAFMGTSPSYFTAAHPANYVTTTINLGTTYAGKTVKIRFRAGSDSSGLANGWEIDDISLSGIVNRPFGALLANKCVSNPAGGGQTNRKPTVTIATVTAQPERATVNLTATASDLDNDPLTYFWSQVSGPAITITPNGGSNTATFVAPEVTVAGGTVVVGVVVSDGTAFSTLATRTITITNVDRAPTVSAGAYQAVDENTLVTLAGSGTDPDGDPVTFAWTQTAGTAVTLTSTTSLTPSFTAPNVGLAGEALTFKLTATAGGLSSSANVNVNVRNVTNLAPTADAGANQQVDERTLVQLHGRGNDPDGDRITFAWVQTSPASPAVSLSSDADPSPTFTAPEVSANTNFVFQLTVSDGALSAVSTTTVTVRNVNRAPLAVATAPAFVNERSTVTLDGTGSSDPDGQAITYLWTVAAGSTLPPGGSLTNAAQSVATFTTGEITADTAVTFNLVVSDGTASSAAASVTVMVRNVDRAPTASAGANQTVDERTPVTLTGNGSDPDGDALGFQWVQIGGTPVTIVDATSAVASFSAPDVTAAGDTLRFRLTVTAAGQSASATTQVTVNNVNRAPVVSAGAAQSVGERTLAQLHGSASDADGDALTLTWTQTSPALPAIALSNAADGSPTFIAPEVLTDTVFVFQLAASDGTATSNASVSITVRNVNRAPVADVGHDFDAVERSDVQVDGSRSFDPDSETLIYAWTQVSGPAVTLVNANAAMASFAAPEVARADATVTLRLTVTDPHGASSTADLAITIHDQDRAPVAAVVRDTFTADERTTVTLDGTPSSDPDGDALTYVWSQTGGPAVAISGANTAVATFLAPNVKDDTTFTFQLVVTDGILASAAKKVSVLVSHKRRKPTALAGAGFAADERTTVSLDGTGSDDPDGLDMTYAWTQTAGPNVALQGASTARPTFTAPDVDRETVLTFQLVVSDAMGAGDPVTVSVTVRDVNRSPVSDAGTNQTVASNAKVKLDGGASRDPDGRTLTYAWQQTSGPNVTLDGANTATPGFTAPDTATGTALTFSLTVSDGSLTSASVVNVFVTGHSGGCSTSGSGGASALVPMLAMALGLFISRRRAAARK